MKISRQELKKIVKECLVEILNEGLSGELSVTEAASHRQLRQTLRKGSRVNEQHSRMPSPTAALQDAIKREAGGNPLMEEIFADTAMNTLPRMISAGDNGSSFLPSVAQQEQFVGTPEEHFGEDVASKWAMLAFANTPKRMPPSPESARRDAEHPTQQCLSDLIAQKSGGPSR